MSNEFIQRFTEEPVRDYTITPTNGQPAIKFRGAFVDEVSSYRNGAYRWTRIKAYVTEGGSFVIEQIGDTSIEGETQYVDARAYSSEEELTRGLGTRSLALSLYDRLGLGVISVR